MSGNTVAVGPGMVSPQQAMFIQQQAMGSARAFPQQGPGGVLQGPLAYLEKTTSNIGNRSITPRIALIVFCFRRNHGWKEVTGTREGAR